MMKSHKQCHQQEGAPITTQSEDEGVHWMTQSTDPTSAQTQSDHIPTDQPDLQRICPIAQFQSSQEEIPPEPIELLFKDRADDLAVEDRLQLAKRRMSHGHTQSPEWVSMQARRIFRCCLCGSPINSGGVERAIRSHLRNTHGNIKDALLITVERKAGRAFEFAVGGGAKKKKKAPQLAI